MHTSFLLKDLAVIMTVAAFVMYICYRLRQPAIIGYLLAGLIVGPFTPPFSLVEDIASIRSISDLGLVFLMFSLGLEFNLPRLRKAGLPAAVSALVVVGGMTLTGFAAGRALGWTVPSSLLTGALMSISGSTIIAKVFFDLRLTQEPFARAVFGLMICDDIAAMVILSVISGLGAHSASLASSTAVTFVRITFFILLFLTLGLVLVPRILAAVARFRNRELTGISVLGLCFAGAYLAAHFNFSIALGTFLMGAIVAATPQIGEVEEWTAPLRDMFSALFFVSAGMLVDPRSVAANWLPVLAIGFLAIAGRSFWGIAASALAGYDLRMSIRIGLSSAQIGEFSFILAAAGAASGLTENWLYGITVAIAMGTTFTFPYLMRNMGRIEDAIISRTPQKAVKFAERYRTLVWKPSAHAHDTERPAIFSKYALRLVIYTTLLAGLLYAGSAAADYAPGSRLPLAIWTIIAPLCAPLTLAIARYCSHIILLAVTISLTKFSFTRHVSLNIRLTYDTTNTLFFSLLGAGILIFASHWLHDDSELALFAGTTLAICLLLRSLLLAAMEWTERILDQIIGLATSEPFHQTLAAGPGQPLENSGTTRWLVPESSPFTGRSIKQLDIRAHTGASVISIYRGGTNIPNPDPSATLQAGDIVILFGTPEQCQAADAFFTSPE